MRYYYFTILIAFLSCSNNPKHKYEYKDLKAFTIDSTVLVEGDLVKIIGMGGSDKNNDKDNVYYYETLVTTDRNSDTIKVLSPLFKLPSEDVTTGREYFSPSEYNYNSNVLQAKFESKTDDLNILIQSLNDLSSNKEEPVNLTDYFNGEMIKEEKVAINKSLPIFNNNYKTVIGILKFDKDPR